MTYLANDDDLVALSAAAGLVDDLEVVDGHGAFESGFQGLNGYGHDGWMRER